MLFNQFPKQVESYIFKCLYQLIQRNSSLQEYMIVLVVCGLAGMLLKLTCIQCLQLIKYHKVRLDLSENVRVQTRG